MSTADAADYLGVTLRTVYRFIDDGQLPAYKFGRVIRVKEEDVQAFIESARIEPGSLEHLHPEPPTSGGEGGGRPRRASRDARGGEARPPRTPRSHAGEEAE